MALNAYLRLTAATHGEIRGSVTQKGREGSILVFAVYHHIVSPRDVASGRPTGKRMHTPFLVKKEVDQSSPLLYSLLTNSERITSWELKFFTPQLRPTAGVGAEVQHFTVNLTNATVASIASFMPNNRRNAGGVITEEIGFTYERIEWVWTAGGISAADDWEAPRT